MEVVYVVLSLAFLAAVGWVLQKIGGFAALGFNRTILSRGEHKQRRQLREPLSFETSAAAEDVIRQLDLYVAAVDKPLGGNTVLYVHSRDAHRVVYVFGSASNVRLQVDLRFSPGTPLTAALHVVQWTEEDGVAADQERLRKLRAQVTAAFKAADPAVRVIEGERSDQSA
ncbi:MAG: hypothetical protein U1E08_05305 [Coriobacteriia bacterium]|nr:hypothetical protein [Coriobacteriia bacterium]